MAVLKGTAIVPQCGETRFARQTTHLHRHETAGREMTRCLGHPTLTRRGPPTLRSAYPDKRPQLRPSATPLHEGLLGPPCAKYSPPNQEHTPNNENASVLLGSAPDPLDATDHSTSCTCAPSHRGREYSAPDVPPSAQSSRARQRPIRGRRPLWLRPPEACPGSRPPEAWPASGWPQPRKFDPPTRRRCTET